MRNMTAIMTIGRGLGGDFVETSLPDMEDFVSNDSTTLTVSSPLREGAMAEGGEG